MCSTIRPALLSRVGSAPGRGLGAGAKLVTLMSYMKEGVRSSDAAGASLLEVHTVDGSSLRDTVTLFIKSNDIIENK